MADIIQIRRDTAANWTSANPTLAQGELGAETDTSKIKIGDGSTAWASLAYLIDAGSYVTESSTSTFTNKTINGSNNTLTNISLTAGVTGTLPVANGGTGSTATTFVNLTSNVTGTLPVANGGTGITAAGTSGNVLISDGTNWASAAPASSGSWTKLQTITASGDAVVEIDFSAESSAYKVFKVVLINVTSDLATQPRMQFKIGGSYKTDSTYHYHVSRNRGNAAAWASNHSETSPDIQWGYYIGDSSGNSVYAEHVFPTVNDGKYQMVQIDGTQAYSAVYNYDHRGSGIYAGAQGNLQAVRYNFSNSAEYSGTWVLYGLT